MKSLETTVSGGIILNNNKILVVNQKGSSWSLPKGHVEQNETLLETAYREIYEETGISSLELIQYLGSYKRYKIGKDINIEDKSELKHLHFYLFKTQETHSIPIDPENPSTCWVEIKDVQKKLTHKKDKDFFNLVKDIISFYSNEFIQIETTVSSIKEAKELSNKLINKKFAACIQIQKITSTYNWKNKVQNEEEYKLSIKTQTNNMSKVYNFFKKEHPYECPEFVVLKITASSTEYFNWVAQSSLAD